MNQNAILNKNKLKKLNIIFIKIQNYQTILNRENLVYKISFYKNKQTKTLKNYHRSKLTKNLNSKFKLNQKLQKNIDKMSQNTSSTMNIFDQFNNLQKEIFKNLFANSLKRPEQKTELKNPKSPKIPKLSHPEAQNVKKPVKQPKTAAIQHQVALNQQQQATTQNIKQEKFEFTKIQPQNFVKHEYGSKILQKVLPVQQNIPIHNLIIHNQFLYPEVPNLTAGSSQNTQQNSSLMENQVTIHKVNKNVIQKAKKVPQVPQVELIIPSNSAVTNESFMTLYKSKCSVKVLNGPSITSSMPVTTSSVQQDVFKTPEVPKLSKKTTNLVSVSKKLKSRRKSDPEAQKPQKQPKIKLPQRKSLGQKKSSPKTINKDEHFKMLMKKFLDSKKSNIYETPRRSFLIPPNKSESNKGLRRGRSKFRNESALLRPAVPEKPFEEMNQEEFFTAFGLIRKN